MCKWTVACLILFSVGCYAAEPAIAVVVNENSAISTLSKNEIVDLYMGRFNRFANGQTATVIDHTDNSTLRESFYQRLVNRNSAQIAAYWARIRFSARAVPPQQLTEPEIRLQLQQVPGAIAYLPVDHVTKGLKVVFVLPAD